MSVSEPITLRAPAVIDLMNEHDLLEVVEIERESGVSPWGWNAYHRELQSEDRRLMLVARLVPNSDFSKALAGYVVGRLAADELHINNIAVRDEYRRAGLATALLSQVLKEAKTYKAAKAYLEVRASNTAAQCLYEKCGFCVVGRRRNYYSNPPEDALIMSAEVGDSA